jgi:hypothetical protein
LRGPFSDAEYTFTHALRATMRERVALVQPQAIVLFEQALAALRQPL